MGQRARHLQQSDGTGIDFNRWEMGLRADPYTAPGQKAEKARIRAGPGLSYTESVLSAQSRPSVRAGSRRDRGLCARCVSGRVLRGPVTEALT